ncbi:CDP-alcohol phosphatidyltransferase family protein [Streptomyces griseiscabiei]|uniref:CDP-alcohol phosphatidyltransferase family protein n=1 Tax=Streptomyces griseiscabiei TaxID=2993540 RepID=A0ABU4L8D2_9ACTN|nr:CDP-alcohol phosphatidyltransferase family protein [Streptomyces griseiscabiei]MBZ3905059.1 CDP-alcohol phosphatidyltransferase family protein [Streptomyces griseiscabiei]MDX2912022.1 CDP-alcohol phosphatidyltransferase family protein [Streptomyces griseiscabiei]
MALINTYDGRLLLSETTVGAGAQVLLLAFLGTAIGLGPAGWLTGLAFGLATWAVLNRALLRTRTRTFGPANRVTLGRAILVGAVTALVADSFQSSPPVSLFVGLTAVALILDGVDGRVARKTGTSTALGARFDMEVDAFLILVLSVYVSMSMGPWVLLIGLMRYVFVAAAKVAPWLNDSLPPSMARKTVAAVQGVFLLVAASGLLPYEAGFGLVALALGSLLWSFGRDIAWLFRNREGRGGATATATTAATTPAAVNDTVTAMAVETAVQIDRRAPELVSVTG